MKNVIAILAVFLLFVACSQTTTTTGIPQTTTPTASSADQIKTDTLAKNDITQNLVIPLNIKKGKAGDTIVFGSVFNLVNMRPMTYIIKLDFIEGRDSSSNKIELSRDAGNALVQTLGGFIPTKEPTYIPIMIKTSTTTQSGTYSYDVYVYSLENGFEDRVESINEKIFVRIE